MNLVPLYTCDRHEGTKFVVRVSMPNMAKRPDIIVWGARYFGWDNTLDKYIERYAYVAPTEVRRDID